MNVIYKGMEYLQRNMLRIDDIKRGCDIDEMTKEI